MYFQNKNDQTCHKNGEQHSTCILYFIIIMKFKKRSLAKTFKLLLPPYPVFSLILSATGKRNYQILRVIFLLIQF